MSLVQNLGVLMAYSMGIYLSLVIESANYGDESLKTDGWLMISYVQSNCNTTEYFGGCLFLANQYNGITEGFEHCSIEKTE